MLSRVPKWYSKITSEDEGISVLLILLLGFIFVIYPLQTMGITNLILVRLFFSLMVISGVWTAGRK